VTHATLIAGNAVSDREHFSKQRPRKNANGYVEQQLVDDVMPYREFKLRVPIGDISNRDEGESLTIRSLFTTLSVTPPKEFLANLYDSFYHYPSAKYPGDPWGRIGRGDMLIFAGDSDQDTLIAIDMFDKATDQMNTVEILVSCPESFAGEVASAMQSIKSSAEVSSALLEGNLGIRETLRTNCFPRLVTNNNTKVMQYARFFRGGRALVAPGSA